MSPEKSITRKFGISKHTETILNVPDQSGTYQTTLGEPLTIDLSGIANSKGPKPVVLEADFLAGRQRGNGQFGPTKRTIYVAFNRIGSHKIDCDTKVEVKLHKSPNPVSRYRGDR